MMDESGRVVEFNPMAETILGWTRSEALGRSLAELIVPGRSRERHHLGLERLISTGQSSMLGRRIEMTASCKDGREIPVELAIRSLDIGGRRIFVGYLRDISEWI